VNSWSPIIPFAWPEDPAWQKPELLNLVQNTPFNALIGKQWSPELRTGAQSAKIKLIDQDSLPRAPLVRLTPQGDRAAVVAGSLWPHVRGFNEGGQAGPTGNPWVDSNGWLIRVAQAKSPGSAIWLTHTPPKGRALTTADYVVAIADARTWDARWVVALDEKLSAGLAAGEGKAKETWKSIAAATAWFEAHRPDKSLRPGAKIGVVSDFTNPVFNDALNLLARRQVAFLAATPDRIGSLPLDKLSAVCTTVEPPPTQLEAFVKRGGKLIRPLASAAPGKPSVTPRFVLTNANTAVAQSKPTDPYLLATDIHLLVTRREDVLRLFNGAHCAASYLEGPGNRAAVELVNYTGRAAGDDVSLQVLSSFRGARMIRNNAEPIDLEIRKSGAGSEVALPKFSCYARVEFS
jgi:hypothetical protein